MGAVSRFRRALNRDTRDPNLRFVDLDGDGHADVLITEDDAFTWHPSLGEEGFGPAERVTRERDDERGPALVFADGTQSIYLADMTGDGLTDLVRIRNGEVCYWPNLGYGRFGAKVTMDNAPWFDAPDQFDQRRVQLADVDGSGVTDILYLHGDGVRLYFNQSGNGWQDAHALAGFPEISDAAAVAAVDLLGNGTACLVWSSPLPNDARPMHAVHRSHGRQQAAPARQDTQQPGRGNRNSIRAIHEVLSPGQARRPAVDHPAAVPGARGRAHDGHRPVAQHRVFEHLQLSPRLLRRRRARVPRLRPRGADRCGGLPEVRRGQREQPVHHRRSHALSTACQDDHLVSHRRRSRSRAHPDAVRSRNSFLVRWRRVPPRCGSTTCSPRRRCPSRCSRRSI